jgi:hypothetical protein
MTITMKLEYFQAFEVEAPFLDPLLPTKIRFIPLRRTRQHPSKFVKAIAVRLDGKEQCATANDISLLTGKEFFQTETNRIGWERLVLWLNNVLTDEEAATAGGSEFEYLKWRKGGP